ncbi:UNVERIFIED_CONTAM: hypothetical protein Sindi_2499300 [Sesamum indicum]
MNAMKDGEWRAGNDIGREQGHYNKNEDRRPKHERNKEPHFQQKYHKYTPLNMTRAKALLMVEKKDVLKWPKHTRFTPAKKYSSKYCRFHRERGHDTEECYQLKDEIERLVRQGYFKNQVSKNYHQGDRRSRSRSQERQPGDVATGGQKTRENAPVKDIIQTIAGGSIDGYSRRSRKRMERKNNSLENRQIMSIASDLDITFGPQDLKAKIGDGNDPMVIKMDITNFTVHKVLVDNGSSADIILKEVLVKMGLDNADLNPVKAPLVGFGGSEVDSLGTIELPVSIGDEPKRKALMGNSVDISFENEVSDSRWSRRSRVRPSGSQTMLQPILKKRHDRKKEKFIGSHMNKREDRIEPIDEHREIELVQGEPTKTTKIRSRMEKSLETMITFLRDNADMFAWSPSDFKRIDAEVIVHRLNVDPTMRSVQQRKRTFGVEKNHIIQKEVDKLLRAGYISEVQYTDWLSNVVVVLNSSKKWRMCTDFMDLNRVCPKDPYTLPRIDQLVDAIAGYELFSMMDAYQGYHQIFMVKEDHSKTSFVTEQAVSQNAVSSVLVREENKIQNPVHYVSKMLQGAELRYSVVEKFVLALVVTARRLRSYFQSHKIVVLTNQPLRSILSRPEASGRLVKWAIELGEHDIYYQSRTSKKSQVLADFVMELSGESILETETWMLNVDGSSNASNGGAGVLIQGPKGIEIEVATRLSFPATNNEAE